MQNELIMRYPASWHREMWREGAPFGNGRIGGMVYGGIYKERILLNHAFLWRGGKTEPLPDVSAVLAKIRQRLDMQKPEEADSLFSDALRQAGYQPEYTYPASLCDMIFITPPKGIFSNYRRTVRMDRAEVTVCWNEDASHFERSVFASRDSQMVFTRYICKNGLIDTFFALELHDTETIGNLKKPEIFKDNREDMLFFGFYNDSAYKPGYCGAVSKIVTDGHLRFLEGGAEIKGASEILIVTATFAGMEQRNASAMAAEKLRRNFDYQEELKKHIRFHKPLFETTELTLSEPDISRSNEELLLDAYEEKASAELIEKLYAYGRYLFICSTSDQGSLPCHLTGLFNGDYHCMWAFYMYNINFEMMYWHTLSGNLPSFLRSALDYVESFMDDYRENARKIYGCRGIWINSVNTPESGLSKCMENHILNWTGGAAWLSQHFWDYYQYTLDTDYLKEHALPFMYEAALFYEDFTVKDADGYYKLYPSVSPENTAGNVRRVTPPGREVEVSVNAVMETALMKELLTNLLCGCQITGMYPEKQEQWRDMLQRIRPYEVNADGALREWLDDFYTDNYRHRHHSHLYPVFPGREISKDHPLYQACVRAEDMRLEYGLTDQCNWSLLMMAGIAARMERGDFALKMLSTLSRTCIMNNFLSVSNDWRRMGPACLEDMRTVPLQLDGNIGVPGIIHEMLVQCSGRKIYILPALPKEWKRGAIRGLLLIGKVRCSLRWTPEELYIELSAEGSQERELCLGSGYRFPDQTVQKYVMIEKAVVITAYGSRQDRH